MKTNTDVKAGAFRRGWTIGPDGDGQRADDTSSGPALPSGPW